MRLLFGYVAGLIFGTGIAFSGMANPAKVLNFFDVAGAWDPSMALVMASALIVTAIGYRLVLRRPAPVADTRFHLPASTVLDARLTGGAAIFGVGWGLSGFCPGGALPAIGTLNVDVLVFVAAMIAGILATRLVEQMRRAPAAATT